MKMIDAEKYVQDNAYRIDLENYEPIGAELRCIDDRASNSDDRNRHVAIPGGGLGLVMDAMGGLTLLRRNGRNVLIDNHEIIKAVEKVVGVIFFHTDRKSLENKGLACGGCGHLNGALSNPSAYLITDSDSKFFIENVLPYVENKLKEKKVEPTVYEGKHDAGAVFVVDSLDIGLPSVSKSGERAYIYHRGFHQKMLKKIADEIFTLLSVGSMKINKDEIESFLLKAAADRLSVTIEKLAHNLPKYAVSKKIQICVEQI